jgi:integrase
MSRRKQEITGLSNERDFPHLVEFALSPGGFRSVFLEFDAFHRERRIPVRRGRSRYREYLTTAEIERLMAAARKSSRYGHRDATMILIGYRHGLRASELCDLQWSQVELATGRLHVRRAKNGSPSVHHAGGRDTRTAASAARTRGIFARLHD